MNRHERRKQQAQERKRGRMVGAVRLDGALKDRFQQDMSSEASLQIFSRIVELLIEWQRDHPGEMAGLEWHEREGKGKEILVGPLGDPAAQKFLAKNEPAMALLTWLDEQTGGFALTLHARIALEYLRFIPGRDDPEPESTIESEGFRMFRAYGEGTGTTTRIPESACPFCGAMMGGASAGNDHVPTPGCPTVCVKCGGISCFADDLTTRRFTDAEWADLHPETRQHAEEAGALFRLAARNAKPKRGEA